MGIFKAHWAAVAMVSRGAPICAHHPLLVGGVHAGAGCHPMDILCDGCGVVDAVAAWTMVESKIGRMGGQSALDAQSLLRGKRDAAGVVQCQAFVQAGGDDSLPKGWQLVFSFSHQRVGV